MTAKERLDKHDREIAAIRSLVKQGMRMLVDLADHQRQTKAELRALAASQRKTDASLQLLIKSLRGGNGNGHGGKL